MVLCTHEFSPRFGPRQSLRDPLYGKSEFRKKGPAEAGQERIHLIRNHTLTPPKCPFVDDGYVVVLSISRA